ncbi:hypothetical protein AAMO2058_001641000 [Amorphochlora amoebiformis]
MGGPCVCDGKQYDEMDNFLIAEMKLDGKKFKDENYRELIRNEKSGDKCWSLGQSRKFKIIENWEEIKVDVMYRANYAKFSQNDKLKKVLCETKGPIEAYGFRFWAHWNGVLLERIREELRDQSKRNEKHLKKLVNTMEDYKFKIRDPRGWAKQEQKKEKENESKTT